MKAVEDIAAILLEGDDLDKILEGRPGNVKINRWRRSVVAGEPVAIHEYE